MTHTECVTTDTPQTHNELSGTVDGNVFQIGSVHGGVHYGAGHGIEDLSALSYARAAELLSLLPPDAIVPQLARVEAAFAAKAIERMEEDLAISIVTRMNTDRLPLVLEQMTPETADLLRAAATAAHEIDTSARQWRSFLGQPTGDLQVVGPSKRGTTGFRRDYKQGSVYWNARTGSGMLRAGIADYFIEQSGLAGWLGFPIGPQTIAAPSAFGTTGDFQRFESTWDYGSELKDKLGTRCGGTVYQSRLGTFSTRGGIGEYFEAKGGTQGPLGFPMSNEQRTEDFSGTEGYFQIFEGGHVFWSEETGAATVARAVMDAHEDWFDILGFPFGDTEPAATSPFGTAGFLQEFTDNLAVYSSEAFGAHILGDEIRSFFAARGATGGAFGFPTSGDASLSRSCLLQHFEGGMIFDSVAFGTLGVTGPIFGAFTADPDLVAELGMPTGPEQQIGSGPDVIQFFQRGVITVVSDEAKCWFQPTPAE
jgi:uncharacterized protein with LGFP repeats